MNHPSKPKLINSKTQIFEFMSFGLPRPLNRKMSCLISHDSLVAADVRRRTFLKTNDIRLLTSAATVRGFKARTLVGRILSSFEQERENYFVDDDPG